jgi:SAM-dependent methyltransferase
VIQPTPWQVGASAPDVYERDLVPAVFGPWAPRVIELAIPKPSERVLDVDCGTGIVARRVADRLGAESQIVGVDLNPAMIAKARSIAPGIDWREASVMALPLPDASFDIVYCQLGLQFFPDRPGALREMYRVLAPQGRLGLMVWRAIEFCPGFGALAAGLERHVSPEAAALMRAPFALHNAGELEALISAAGFRDVVVQPATGMVRFPSVEHLVHGYVAGSPLAAHVAKASDSARAALVGDVQSALAAYVSVDGLAFPIEAHLASAKK